jgi:DNA-binding response OmpR family regulator
MMIPPTSNLDPTRTAPRLCVIGEADPFLARLLRRFAEKSGLRTLPAQTGEDVLELARRERPVAIVLEPELPGKLRGWEAARVLETGADTCAIPVILCAWLDENEARALVGLAHPSMCVAYLRKPDLHYEDFTAALKAAGVTLGDKA